MHRLLIRDENKLRYDLLVYPKRVGLSMVVGSKFGIL